MRTQKLPIGIENFKEMRKQEFYYVDKTGLIVDLLADWGKVNLFTRPRRFGKTLNMSMLKCFFEVGGDKSIFNGLKVSEEKALCETYMGKFPVIFFSLKDADGLTFEVAYDRLRGIIRQEATRLDFLMDSDGNVFFNEVNTVPGMTETSHFITLSEEIGFERLFAILIRSAFSRKRKNDLLLRSYE